MLSLSPEKHCELWKCIHTACPLTPSVSHCHFNIASTGIGKVKEGDSDTSVIPGVYLERENRFVCSHL